jgi:transposase
MSGESSTVLKIEYRAVMKYLVMKGKKAKEIFEDLTETYLNFSPSYATIKRWTRLFQQGRESIEDDPHPGRPQTVVTEENVKKVENLILQDRRIRVRQIADELKISTIICTCPRYADVGCPKCLLRLKNNDMFNDGYNFLGC